MSQRSLPQSYQKTFNRYELKYLVQNKVARELPARMSANVRADMNAGVDGF